jgi:hypothetical protein
MGCGSKNLDKASLFEWVIMCGFVAGNINLPT